MAKKSDKKNGASATPAAAAASRAKGGSNGAHAATTAPATPKSKSSAGGGPPLTFFLAALPGVLLAAGYVFHIQRSSAATGGRQGSGGTATRRATTTTGTGTSDEWTAGYYADPIPDSSPPSTHALLYPNGGGGGGDGPEYAKFESEPQFRSFGRLYNELGQIVPSRRHFANDTALYRGPAQPGTHFQWPAVRVGHKRTVPGLFGGDGLPVELETLTDPDRRGGGGERERDPRVFYVHNFLSPAEAEEFVEFSTSEDNPYKMAPSTGGTHKAWNQGGSGATLKTRTSMNAFDVSSDVSRVVKRRAFRLLRMGAYDEGLADGIQILRYELGQAYVAHHDYFPKRQSDDFNWDPSRGGSNRFATIFLYLSDVEVGGQTVFPKSERLTEETSADLVARLGEAPPAEFLNTLREEAGLEAESWEDELIQKCYSKFAVPPRRGDAILFYSQRPDGALDEASLHGACPVLKGTKWGANLWVWNACRYSLCKDDPLNPTEELPKELKAPFPGGGIESTE